MVAISSLPPIPGQPIDPPPKQAPAKVRQLEAQGGNVGTGVGVGYRAFVRFVTSQASLLAAGTAYYLFLAMFAIIALAYGLAAAIDADRFGRYLTDALGNAFPGLIGDNGIDPAQLRSVGQALSIVGALGLFYAGGGAVIAAVRSLHRIYGAPKDPRKFVKARGRALLWLALLGTLILLSFAMSSVTADASGAVRDALGVSGWGMSLLVSLAAVVLALAVNYLIVYLILGHLGGIRPERHARVVGAAIGAVVIEVLKNVMGLLIAFTVAKPQYGAVAAPIGVLFVLYLQSMTLYGSAAITAGIADRAVPLDALTEARIDEADAAEQGFREVAPAS